MQESGGVFSLGGRPPAFDRLLPNAMRDLPLSKCKKNVMLAANRPNTIIGPSDSRLLLRVSRGSWCVKAHGTRGSEGGTGG
jgi:hypothetical protein